MSSVNVSIVVASPTSTGIVFNPSMAGLIAPIPAGTNLGQFVVSPSNWTGTVSLSGADAAAFTLDTNLDLLVGAQPLTVVRTYNVTATANP